MKTRKEHSGKSKRRLVTCQMTPDEIQSLPPLLKAKVIDRAARKWNEVSRHEAIMAALDDEEDP